MDQIENKPAWWTRLGDEWLAEKLSTRTKTELRSTIVGLCDILTCCQTEVEQLRAELDAAKHDLSEAARQHLFGEFSPCVFCIHGEDPECQGCNRETMTNGFEWCGLRENE